MRRSRLGKGWRLELYPASERADNGRSECTLTVEELGEEEEEEEEKDEEVENEAVHAGSDRGGRWLTPLACLQL